MSTTGGRSAAAQRRSHIKAYDSLSSLNVIGYDVIAKACLRQGSFAVGNRGMSTTGGEIRQRSAAVT